MQIKLFNIPIPGGEQVNDEGNACQRHVLPLVAFTRHADARAFRKNVLIKIETA